MLFTRKLCLECKEPLSGRSDKKFCTDSCRTAYHNRSKPDGDPAVREVNRILIRNRSILLQCVRKRPRKVTEDYLLARGFNFNYYTHVNRGPKGEPRVFCYEVGYARHEKNAVILVKDSEIPRYFVQNE